MLHHFLLKVSVYLQAYSTGHILSMKDRHMVTLAKTAQTSVGWCPDDHSQPTRPIVDVPRNRTCLCLWVAPDSIRKYGNKVHSLGKIVSVLSNLSMDCFDY